MARKVVTAQSVGGPRGTSSQWTALDETALIAAQATLGTTPVLTPISVVPQVSGALPGGLPAPDSLTSGHPIATLEGGQVVNLAANLAATAALGLGLAVYRAGAIVGGTIAFGWLASGTISPTIAGATVVLGGGAGAAALAQMTTVAMPAVAANTALTPDGYIPLLPGDLVVLIAVSQTGTVAVGILAASAKIT